MDQFFSIFNAAELQRFFVYLTTALSLEMIIKILISCLFIIWFAVAVWVIKDITTRSTNIIVQSFSLLLIIFFTPIFGLPLYLLIRPRSTIFEQHYEENWLENFGHQEAASLTTCTNCSEEIEIDAKFCPQCGTKQFDTCDACHAKMLLSWKYCTSCGNHRHSEKEKKTPVKESPKSSKKTKKITD